MRKIIVPIAVIATLSTLASCNSNTTSTNSNGVRNIPGSSANNSSYGSPSGSNPGNYGASPGGNSDSSHTQDVSYETPGGFATIEFNVEVKDGFIMAVSARPKSTHPLSSGFQAGFADQVSSKVVGRPIHNFDTATIAGASLVTKAFVEYVNSI
ncbi:hypothetical protein H7169_00725 [Candidatus Gracilibacteria bacterium]|nr:hypothetical protein [Candidatus Gracilibacteria bacterium]